ncbi:MAG: hypothetical protein MK081_05095 [Flavobacteriales bacterium]|nr:hypothetical protein [Flavobacteriales bacterium]
MKKAPHILALLIGTLITFSCKNDVTEDMNEENQSIITFTIDNPIQGATYDLNDTVHIDVMLSAERLLDGYHLRLVNTSDNNSIVWEEDDHDHSTTLHIHDYWINDVTMHSDMRLDIEGFTTHQGESETTSVSFHCHPM